MAAPITTRLILNTKNFTKGLNVASKGLGKLGGAIGGALGLITKLGLAFTAFGGIITALILRQSAFIDRLGKVSDVIGVNIQTLQKFRFAAEQGGVSIEQADVALRRFARRLGEAKRGTGELLPVLRQLGLKQKDIIDLSPEQALLFLSDAIKNARDDTDALRIAFKAFDSEGAELVKTLRDGADGLNELFQEAEALGFVLDRETVQGVEDFNDSLNALQTLVVGLANRFVAELAPALREVTEEFIKFIKSFKDEEGSFESLGKFLKDQFIVALVSIVQIFEQVLNIIIELTNAVIKLGRAVPGLELFPLSAEDQARADQLNTTINAMGTALTVVDDNLSSVITDFGKMSAVGIKGFDSAAQALKALASAGVDITELQRMYDDIPFLERLVGGGDKANAFLLKLQTALRSTLKVAETELAGIEDEFSKVDFGSLVEMLLGNTEDAKEKAKNLTETIVDEVVVTGQKLKPSLMDIILDALFPVDLVDKFFDTYEDEAASTGEKIKALFTLVGDSIERALPNLRDKLQNSGIGDFTKTLEDGLVKAGQMLEDSLASAIATGKADFSALGDHIRQVLAKAIVQKFITGPIMGLFGLAKGGPAKAGQPYIVGEEGPELFVPNQSGTVVPNHALGSSGGTPMSGMTNINYNINAVDARSFKQLVAQDPEFIFSVTQAGARRMPS